MNDQFELTEGAFSTERGHVFPELGIWIPHDDPDKNALLLEYGFASEQRHSVFRSRSRAARLKPGLFPAIMQSATHNGLGLGRTFTGLAAFAVTGFIFDLPSFAAMAASTALIFLSVLVHEAGHAAALRRADPSVAGVLVARGWTSHLVRPLLDYRQERRVIVAGPLAPILATVFFLPTLLISPMILVFWLALGLGHLLFLFIPVGDGANLRNLKPPRN